MKIGGLLGSYFFFNYSVLFTTCKAFLNSFIIYKKINVLFSFFYINYTIYDIQIYLLSNIQTKKVLINIWNRSPDYLFLPVVLCLLFELLVVWIKLIVLGFFNISNFNTQDMSAFSQHLRSTFFFYLSRILLDNTLGNSINNIIITTRIIISFAAK